MAAKAVGAGSAPFEKGVRSKKKKKDVSNLKAMWLTPGAHQAMEELIATFDI